jgi:inorganic triphosphatase YgiF
MAAAPTETEIKLVLEPGAREDIERHPAFAQAARKGSPRRELTTYFDADNLSLHRHGYSLRIRGKGDRYVQTLKKVHQDAAMLHRRNEWEWKLPGNNLALQPVSEILGGELDRECLDVKPQFITEVRRQRYEIARAGSRIEAALDDGVIRAGDRAEAIGELELEIKAGPPGPAYRLALDLLEHAVLRLGTESKADRGYRLLSGSEASPVKALAARLPREARLAEALQLTGGEALHAFVANMPAARAGQAEGTHQMRVALRRLRTMLVLYAPCLDRGARRRFNDAIRDLGAVLGRARDWDVFVGETLRAAEDAGVHPEWIGALAEPANAKCEEAHREVRDLIDGKGPAELVLGMQAWLLDPEWAAVRPDSAHLPVGKIMPDLLDRVVKKVARRGRGAAKLPPAELHPLRKSVKKLRYSTESVPELYGAKRAKRYAKKCKKLQTLLGAINDAQVTKKLLAEIAPPHSAAWAPPAGALLKWNAGRLKEARRDLDSAWRKLKGADPFWR